MDRAHEVRDLANEARDGVPEEPDRAREAKVGVSEPQGRAREARDGAREAGGRACETKDGAPKLRGRAHEAEDRAREGRGRSPAAKDRSGPRGCSPRHAALHFFMSGQTYGTSAFRYRSSFVSPPIKARRRTRAASLASTTWAWIFAPSSSQEMALFGRDSHFASR